MISSREQEIELFGLRHVWGIYVENYFFQVAWDKFSGEKLG